MTVLMSLSPDEKEPGEAPRYIPRPAPGNSELLRDEVLHYAAGPFDAARRVREMLGEESPGEELRSALSGLREFLGQGLTMASEVGADLANMSDPRILGVPLCLDPAKAMAAHIVDAVGDPIDVLLDRRQHVGDHRRAARPGDREQIGETGQRQAEIGARAVLPFGL